MVGDRRAAVISELGSSHGIGHECSVDDDQREDVDKRIIERVLPTGSSRRVSMSGVVLFVLSAILFLGASGIIKRGDHLEGLAVFLASMLLLSAGFIVGAIHNATKTIVDQLNEPEYDQVD